MTKDFSEKVGLTHLGGTLPHTPALYAVSEYPSSDFYQLIFYTYWHSFSTCLNSQYILIFIQAATAISLLLFQNQ